MADAERRAAVRLRLGLRVRLPAVALPDRRPPRRRRRRHRLRVLPVRDVAPVAHPAALHRRHPPVDADAASSVVPRGCGSYELPASRSAGGIALGLALAAPGAVCAYYGDLRRPDGRLRHAGARGDAAACGSRAGPTGRRSRSAPATSLVLVLPFFVPPGVQAESGFARTRCRHRAVCRAAARTTWCRRRTRTRGCSTYARQLGPWAGSALPRAPRRRCSARPASSSRFAPATPRAIARDVRAALRLARPCSRFWASFGPRGRTLSCPLSTCRRSRSCARRRGSGSSSSLVPRASSPRSRCGACSASRPRVGAGVAAGSRSPPAIGDVGRLSPAVVPRARPCRPATPRCRTARARRSPSSRSTANASRSRCTRSTCSSRRPLDADGQRLQRRDPARLPRGGRRSSTRSRRTTRSRCWRAAASATSRCTGTCMRTGRTRSAAAGAVSAESAGRCADDDRMTLYEVVKYP